MAKRVLKGSGLCPQSGSVLSVREVKTPVGLYTLTACDAGIHGLRCNGLKDENFNPLLNSDDGDSQTACPQGEGDKGTPMEEAVTWLKDFFYNPSRLSLKIPPTCFPVQESTEFERKVWQTLGSEVGFGQTISYAGLGDAAIQNSKASRAVGTAMKKNPIALIIPCHRVVRSDGSSGNYAGGTANTVKKWLIEHEQKNMK